MLFFNLKFYFFKNTEVTGKTKISLLRKFFNRIFRTNKKSKFDDFN